MQSEGRRDGNRLWLLAVLITVATSAYEIAQPDSGPLVAIYLLAALLGLGLSARHYRLLVCLIVVGMTVPLMFHGEALGDDRISEVAQRLAGLACLGLIVIASEKRSLLSDEGPHMQAQADRAEPRPLLGGLAGVEPASEWVDLGLKSNEFQDFDEPCFSEQRTSAKNPCSGLTRVRSPGEGEEELDDDDEFELSINEITSHVEVERIVHRLRMSGKFTEEQLSIVDRELQQSVGGGLGTQLVRPLEPGAQIGRFVVEAPLGRGGEGHVYRGRDLSGEQAAIKILHNLRVSDRFRREMHLVRQLAHPNIVTAYEVGEFNGPALHHHGVARGS